MAIEDKVAIFLWQEVHVYLHATRCSLQVLDKYDFPFVRNNIYSLFIIIIINNNNLLLYIYKK